MAEPVDGNELKIRNFELPPAVAATDIQDDHAVALDSPISGVLSAVPKYFVERGITKLSYGAGTPVPSGPNPEDQPRIPIGIRSRVRYYPLADIFSDYGTLYLGPKSSNPSVDNYGAPLKVGSTYYNVSSLTMMVFNPGGAWVVASAAYPGALTAYYYFPNVDTTVLPVGGPGQPDARGNILTFDVSGGPTAVDPVNVYMNGALLANGVDYTVIEGSSGAGDYIQLTRAICGGSVAVIQVFSRPIVTFTADAVAINDTTWIFDGVATTFPLRDFTGSAVLPENAVNCLVVADGRVMQPNVEYSVSGTNIIFGSAPLVGQNIWVTVGLPVGAGTLSDPLRTAEIQALQLENFQLTTLVSALTARVTALEEQP
jgi:hypothetical protein